MSSYLSNKLRVISFISIVAVVYWHSYMNPLPLSQFSTFYFIQNSITSGLVRFCVPLFFTISGYLFFIKPFNYLNQLTKRIKSLLVPYLLWAILGALFIYSLLLIPAIGNRMNLKWQITWVDVLNHITLSPIQYQFWFLRDLMVLTLISPAIYWLAKKSGFIFLIPLALLWFLTNEASFIIRSESLLFFSIGSMLAIKKSPVESYRLSSVFILISALIWILTSLIYGYTISVQNTISPWSISIFLIFFKTIGIITIWFGYDHIQTSLSNWLSPLLLESTFFIFCFHEPLLTIFEKVAFLLPSGLIFFYFFNPLISIFASFQLYKMLKSKYPGLLAILSGYRQVK